MCVGDPCVHGMSFQGAERTQAAQSSVIWGGGILLQWDSQTSQFFAAWSDALGVEKSKALVPGAFPAPVWGG